VETFVKPVAEYRRDLNLVATYIHDAALYLNKMTGQPIETCVSFVKKTIGSGGRRPLHIPNVMLLQRNKQLDREKKVVSLQLLLREIQTKKEILSPSLTTYTNPETQTSVIARYVDANLNKRSKAKKLKFEATMNGDHQNEAIQESVQTSLKIKNNSLSGAQCSPFTILWNKTAHSTLTSTCRCATSYGNANNERFLQGNRHYWSPDITRNNIISIIGHTDLNVVSSVLDRFGLVAPSVEDTLELIRRSSHYYWRSQFHWERIVSLVSTLTPIERAAVVYTSNLYDLAKLNPELVKRFIGQLSTCEMTPLPEEDADIWLKHVDSDIEAYLSMLAANVLDGRSFKKGLEDQTVKGILAANVKKLMDTLEEYRDLIQLFWVSDHLPPSVYHVPTMIRKAVLVSDTDSTIFTVAHWAQWMTGSSEQTVESDRVANSIIYLAGQTVRHMMARLSANMGVHPKDIFRLSMKNEYYFSVFAMTGRAKHYYAYRAAQEGNVFKSPKIEIKGVALRNSNTPSDIVGASHQLMHELMTRVLRNEPLSLTDVLNQVKEIEIGLNRRMVQGDPSVFKVIQIKTKDSYKSTAKSSNYDHYLLWQHAFADKYGPAPDLPYRAVKIVLTTDNPTRFQQWLNTMHNQRIASHVRQFFEERIRKEMSMVLLPEDLVIEKGIPDEFRTILDHRSMIAQLMEGFYIVLESMGYYLRNGFNTRLAMDQI